MLVAIQPQSPTKAAALASVERYGSELRESYLDRIDKLTFRVDDGVSEHRFFENGRKDNIKQVIESREEDARTILYASRDDRCTQFTRSLAKDSHAHTFRAQFDGRPDGILTVALALKAGQRLDVGADSAPSLVREKMLHVAVKLNPSAAVGKFLEVYQDQDAHELRVVTQEDEFGKRKTQTFSNSVPTDDPRYEMAKILSIGAVKIILDLEREVYLDLLPFTQGETNEDMIIKHHMRLYNLASSLFTAFDEVSIAL